MTTRFEDELRAQPETLARLLREGRAAAEALAAAWRARAPRFALLAARGSSDNAARYGQYLLGIHNRLVAALATPSVFTHYAAPPALGEALVVGISQSGRSPDVVEVVSEARRQGAATLAVVNDDASPLARAAEDVFPLRAGPEQAVAATKTYTAQLAALAMLSAALRQDARAWDELERLPGLVARALAMNAGSVAAAAGWRDATRLIVVGRGYNLATALELTLKIKETSGVMADGYSSADFLHGPKTLVESSLPFLVVAPGPRVFDDLEGVVRLAREAGAPLAVVSERPELLAQASIALALPPDVPEWLSPIVAVVPGQLFALGLSLARGRHPDAPRGLTKITETR